MCVCVCVCVCANVHISYVECTYSVVMSKEGAVCCELRTGSHNDMDTPHVQLELSFGEHMCENTEAQSQ